MLTPKQIEDILLEHVHGSTYYIGDAAHAIFERLAEGVLYGVVGHICPQVQMPEGWIPFTRIRLADGHEIEIPGIKGRSGQRVRVYVVKEEGEDGS